MGALGAAAVGGRAFAQQAGGPALAGVWDDAAGRYTLPPLAYGYDALEPHIDAQTMRIHHDRHHAGYVRGANAALEALDAIRAGVGDAGLIKHWERQLAFHASGHINHSIFWRTMAPAGAGGGGEPAGALARAIDRDFGSFGAFTTHFIAAAASVEGAGWGWLVYEPVSGRLRITQTMNQQNDGIQGAVPLLGVDVWEHAYYLRYQNRRREYLAAFMNVIDWAAVGARFDAAAG
ncbi:MAG: superoxide dismutase [Planctomycetota bacterium]|nr:MAG: superoxide dismutase [Planctomycetota bacterium]